eukprot:Rmarinus@m.25624
MNEASLILLISFLFATLHGLDCRVQDHGCLTLDNCDSGLVILEHDCVELRGYGPNVTCTFYYNGALSSSGDAGTDICVQVHYDFVDVADDVLLLMSSSSEQYSVGYEEILESPFVSFSEGVLVAFLSNSAIEGSGFQLRFLSYDTCGNGFVDEHEECDHNGFENPGCPLCCKVSPGVVCESKCNRTLECRTACGDGIVQSDMGEECDLGDDVTDSSCVDCKIVEGGEDGETFEQCSEDDVPAFYDDTGVIISGYNENSYCLWAIFPEVNQCLTFTIFELDLADDILYVYSYPDWTELCVTFMGTMHCGNIGTFGEGDYFTVSEQVVLILEGNGNYDVGVGFHWQYSTMPLCGNGVIDGIEMCDDGGTESDDGCSQCCVIEPGYTCTPASNVHTTASLSNVGPSTCWVACGDGVVETSNVTGVYETCDDMNSDDTDGCVECLTQEGFVCEGEPSVCWKSSCGNGRIDATEECDDMNDVPNDGCHDCTLDENSYCRGEPSICSCVPGASKVDNGTCVFSSEVRLEVGMFEHSDDCDCYLGSASSCCLFKALEYTGTLPTNVHTFICLHSSHPHYVTATAAKHFHTYIVGRTITLEPCEAEEVAVVDLGFQHDLVSTKQSVATIRNLHLMHSPSSALQFIASEGTIQGVTFERCVGWRGASAISISDGSNVTATNVAILSNAARFAPIHVEDSNFVLDNARVENCAGGTAGGLFIRSNGPNLQTVVLLNVKFLSNQGLSHGVIFGDVISIVVENSIFQSNVGFTSTASAVLQMHSCPSAMFRNASFSNNGFRDSRVALSVFQLFFTEGTNAYFELCSFVNNSALTHYDPKLETIGGAIFANDRAKLGGTALYFEGNEAAYGGAVCAKESSLDIENSEFRGNRATHGGVFYLHSGTGHLVLTLCSLIENDASEGAMLFADTRTIVSFTHVQTASSYEDPSKDVVGYIQTCSDGPTLCGFGSVCVDAVYGVECQCPPSTVGNPLELCYGLTHMNLGLLGSTIERTLAKPDVATACLQLASTGGLGRDDPVVRWIVGSVSPASSSAWLQIQQLTGSMEAGYCGAGEEESDIATYVDSSATTAGFSVSESECDAYDDGLPDTDLLPLALSTRGLSQGRYTAAVALSSDSDSVKELFVRVTLDVLTFASGSTTVVASKNSVPALCSIVAVTTENAAEYVVNANDIEGIPLGHGGDDLSVSILPALPAECGINGAHPNPASAVDILSLVDEGSGVYRMRLLYERTGYYVVDFGLNGESLANSPVIVLASCSSGKEANSDSICHPKDYTMQAVVLASAVVAGGGVCFFGVMQWRRRSRSKRKLLSDHGKQAILLAVAVLMDVCGAILHWVAVAYLASSPNEEEQSRASLYGAFAALATVLTCLVATIRIALFASVEKTILYFSYLPDLAAADEDLIYRPRKGGEGGGCESGCVEPAEESNTGYHFTELSGNGGVRSAAASVLHRVADECHTLSYKWHHVKIYFRRLWKRHSVNQVEGIGPRSYQLVLPMLREIDMAKVRIYQILVRLLALLVAEVPLAVLASEIVFTTSTKKSAMIADLCVTAINAGSKLQSGGLLRDAISHRRYFCHKVRKLQDSQEIQKLFGRNGLVAPSTNI